jgi:rubrerythrin
MPDDFCRLLDEAIKDEKEAPKLYFKLRRELSKEESTKYTTLADKILDTIAGDETSHLNLLMTIKRHVCPIRE